ncbi:MAG TPA: PilX N-terminal domain-containing pilus assembly protein, partial [Candidatus Saccharimonadales bacterium]|nr:PilX N-terminal domain-containing pilus assembly protein [Candidatus Saccharimonadales bacterium]
MSALPHPAAGRRAESGMVAIMVTLILMVVISLLVLGFAQISRHEQGNTLDRHLSAQAFYAAESGINDAASAIRQKLSVGDTVPAKAKCNDFADYPTLNTASKLASDVKYSCVLINPAPLQLNYSVGADAVVVPLISGSGQPFQTVTVSWTPITEAGGGFPADPLGGCPSAAGALYPVAGAGAWTCKYPMLRAEMVRTTSLSRSSLLAGNRVNFLEPTT